MSYLDRTKHISKFGGNIWYISKGAGSDTNTGKYPDQAFETIGAGITAMSDGDALSIKAGIYTETGLDLSNNAAEMWCEIGVLIDPISGTALTISGNSCSLEGMHKITPATGQIGLLISGNECHIEHGKVLGGGTGIKITGMGTMINNYASGNQTTIAFDIQGIQTRLTLCNTVGIGSTYGYKINGGADTGVLRDCTSVGHTTAGFYIATGSKDWTLINCSSGAGDGKWIDIDSANVWSNFTYDDMVYKTITFVGIPTTYNIFKVSGSVKITNLFGHVTTVIANTTSNIYLEVYSVGGVLDLTNNVGAPDLDSLPVGSLVQKMGDSTDAIEIANSATPAILEYGTKDPEVAFIVTADADQDTYIRLNITAALASGAIHWHCHWAPLDDLGYVEKV